MFEVLSLKQIIKDFLEVRSPTLKVSITYRFLTNTKYIFIYCIEHILSY